MFHSLVRRLEQRDDSGFTILEMVVALMIIALAMISLGLLYVSVASTAALARERQEANSLANQVLEEMRAMPYTTVTTGLANWGTELSADPNIVAGHFKPAYNASIDEVLQSYTPTSAPDASCATPGCLAPLYPHSATVSLGKVQFTQRAYVTQVAGSAQPSYWLTAVISWTSAATKQKAKTVALRSQLFSPSGCLSLSTHPFSGPCQAFYYGNAGVASGSISVAGISGAPMLTGLDANGGSISLPELLAGMQVEQTTSMSGKATTSAASLASSTGTASTGGQSVTTLADSDPSTAGTGTASGSTPLQTAATLSAGNGSVGTFMLNPTTSDTGSLVGTVSSGASPACKDVDGATTIATTQPCASGNVQALGTTASSVLNLPNLYGRQVAAMTLASVAASPTPSYAMTTRFAAANATYCPTASGAGCSVSSVKRSLGPVMVGGLPLGASGDTLTSPGVADMSLQTAGFSGLVKLTGYADSAVASTGVGAGTSTASRAGTISYWDPANCAATSNYCSVSLSTAAMAAKSPAATAHYKASDNSFIDVAMSASVSASAASPATTGASPCQSPACTTQSSVTPWTLTLSYTISHSGTTLGAFTVNVDLGRVLAKATYRAAPSA